MNKENYVIFLEKDISNKLSNGYSYSQIINYLKSNFNNTKDENEKLALDKKINELIQKDSFQNKINAYILEAKNAGLSLSQILDSLCGMSNQLTNEWSKDIVNNIISSLMLKAKLNAIYTQERQKTHAIKSTNILKDEGLLSYEKAQDYAIQLLENDGHTSLVKFSNVIDRDRYFVNENAINEDKNIQISIPANIKPILDVFVEASSKKDNQKEVPFMGIGVLDKTGNYTIQEIISSSDYAGLQHNSSQCGDNIVNAFNDRLREYASRFRERVMVIQGHTHPNNQGYSSYFSLGDVRSLLQLGSNLPNYKVIELLLAPKQDYSNEYSYHAIGYNENSNCITKYNLKFTQTRVNNPLVLAEEYLKNKDEKF